jgi:hypothetical protein
VTEQRSRTDWAHQIKELVDLPLPTGPENSALVMDNLNTHTPASFTVREAFDPAEALAAHREEAGDPAGSPAGDLLHAKAYGSWLNMAEIELSVLRAATASIGECRISKASKRRSQPGSNGATPRLPRLTGASLRRMLASSSSDSILHFRSNSALVGEGTREGVLCRLRTSSGGAGWRPCWVV